METAPCSRCGLKSLYAVVRRQVHRRCRDELNAPAKLKYLQNASRPSGVDRRALNLRPEGFLRLAEARGLVARQTIVGDVNVANDRQNEGVLNSNLVSQCAEQERNYG